MRRRFTVIQKSCGWTGVYIKMSERAGTVQTEALFDKATDLQKKYKNYYCKEKGIRRTHIMGAVAIAALYMPLSEMIGKDDAVDLIAEAMTPASVAKNRKIGRLPPSVFMKIAGLITGIIFSEKAGFKRKWHCNTNHEKRYHLITCPYVETFDKLGCKEVCTAVSIQDDISFGNMKNDVIFERKETLGRGDKCCDFCFRIKE